MDLLSPGFLLLLALLPVLVGVRIWLLRRRRTGLRYSSLSLVHEALPRSSCMRRHLPFALFVLALASLVVAMARPVEHRERARRPDDRHPGDGRVAEHVRDRHPTQPPDRGRGRRVVVHRAPGIDHPDRDRRVRRVRRDRPAADDRPGGPARRRREPDDRPPDGRRQRDPADRSTRSPRSTRASPRARPSDSPLDAAPEPVPNGAYAPAIIVLLTDGASNAGPLPVEAAEQAAARGVRVYTIGFGTENPGRAESSLRVAVHRAANRARARTSAGSVAAASASAGAVAAIPARDRRGDADAPSPRRPAAPTTRPRAPTSCTPSSRTSRRT